MASLHPPPPPHLCIGGYMDPLGSQLETQGPVHACSDCPSHLFNRCPCPTGILGAIPRKFGAVPPLRWAISSVVGTVDHQGGGSIPPTSVTSPSIATEVARCGFYIQAAHCRPIQVKLGTAGYSLFSFPVAPQHLCLRHAPSTCGVHHRMVAWALECNQATILKVY